MMLCRSGLVTVPVLMDTDGSSRQAPHPGAVDIHTLDNPFSLESSFLTNNYTLSSGFMLTTLAVSNPTMAPV